jgi:hypothetical protein
MDTIRNSIACRAASALILLASVTAVTGCGNDDDDKGKVDGGTDTSRADGALEAGRPDGSTSIDSVGASDVSTTDGPPDLGVADLVVADMATPTDAGVKAGCIADTVCYEYGPDYTDANVANHCSPQPGTQVAVCPADLMGPRIGSCVTKSTFGTLHTIYYKRVDPRSAQVMCVSKGGVWYHN